MPQAWILPHGGRWGMRSVLLPQSYYKYFTLMLREIKSIAQGYRAGNWGTELLN